MKAEKWFAWHPVLTEDNGSWTWLKYVGRKPDDYAIRNNLYWGLNDSEWIYTTYWSE